MSFYPFSYIKRILIIFTFIKTNHLNRKFILSIYQAKFIIHFYRENKMVFGHIF